MFPFTDFHALSKPWTQGLVVHLSSCYNGVCLNEKPLHFVPERLSVRGSTVLVPFVAIKSQKKFLQMQQMFLLALHVFAMSTPCRMMQISNAHFLIRENSMGLTWIIRSARSCCSCTPAGGTGHRRLTQTTYDNIIQLKVSEDWEHGNLHSDTFSSI